MGNEATFVLSTRSPFEIFFGVLERGPIYSARVRRLASILRRARVNLFIVAFWTFGPDFPSLDFYHLDWARFIIYWKLPT